MKIEVKDIEKITLGPNDYLWITFDREITREEIDNMAKNLSRIVPETLLGKIVLGPDSLHLQKIEIKSD